MALGKAAELIVRIKTDTKGARADIDDTASTFGRMGDTLKTVFAPAAIAGGIALAAGGLVKVTMAASDLNETVNASEAIFGDASKAVQIFAQSAARNLGMSKREAIDAANTFATFGKSAGLAGDDLVGFSTQMVTLAADLASFKNTSPEEAILAIGAAMRGEMEPIRKYGVLLDDASLRQEALSMGITDTTDKALTPQQKVLASQSLILKKTTDAQGDYARTSDGLANSTKSLTAQFEDFQTAIGDKLLPVAKELVGFVNDKMIPAITDAANSLTESDAWNDYIKTLTDLKDDVLPSLVLVLQPVLDQLKTLGEWAAQNKEVMDTLKWMFIGLTVVVVAIGAAMIAFTIVAVILSAVLTGAMVFAISLVIKIFGWLKDKALELWDAFIRLKDGIAEAATDIWNAVNEKFTSVRDFISGIIEDIKKVGKDVWDWLTSGLDDKIESVKRLFNNLVGFLMGIPGRVTDALSGLWDHVPKPPDWVPFVGGRAVIPGPMPRGVPRATTVPLASAPSSFRMPERTTVVNVTIQSTGLGVDSPRLQRDLVEALDRYTRRNGPVTFPVDA